MIIVHDRSFLVIFYTSDKFNYYLSILSKQNFNWKLSHILKRTKF